AGSAAFSWAVPYCTIRLPRSVGSTAMSTRELIHAEIANVSEEHLEELYGPIQRFTASKAATQGGIMAKLRGIRIEAPADFATNLDLYLSGEKRVSEDVH